MQQAFLDHLLGKPQMAGVKNFQLGFDAQFGDAFGPRAQRNRGGDVNGVAVAKVEGAAIQGADFGQQLLDMDQPRQGADQVGVGAELCGRFAGSDFQVAAHAGGQVDDDVHARIADAVHHLGVQGRVAAELARLGVAHVAVHHGRTGLGRLDCGSGDLRGGDGHMRAFASGVSGAGQGAGDDDVGVHNSLLRGG